jgi:hypothetical protein
MAGGAGTSKRSSAWPFWRCAPSSLQHGVLCCNTGAVLQRVLLRSRTLRATGHLHSRVSPLGVLLLCLAVSSANTRLLPLPPSSSARGWAHPRHICTGTGLTPATSAPGLRASLPHITSGAPLARVVAHALRGRLRVARRETRSERSAERDDSPSAACVAYLGRRRQRRRGKAQARLPVLAQMWPQHAGRVQSRCRCGRGEPSPGADVTGVYIGASGEPSLRSGCVRRRRVRRRESRSAVWQLSAVQRQFGEYSQALGMIVR